MPSESTRKSDEILPPLSEDDRMLSGLCYPLWFLACPYVLLTNKKNELFLYFHALQGLFYGAGVTVISFFSVLFVYFAFFFRTTNNLINPDARFDTQMTLSTLSVLMLSLILFLVVLALFLTMYFGWKASVGKIFRLPVIGSLAYDRMSQEKSRLEMEYFDSLENPPDEKEETPSDSADAIYPAEFAGLVKSYIETPSPGTPAVRNKPDYEHMLRMNPPVEKLKSIFSSPSSESPDTGRVEGTADNAQAFSSRESFVDKDRQVQFQTRVRQETPPRPPQARYEPPPVKKNPPVESPPSPRRAISALDKFMGKSPGSPMDPQIKAVSAFEGFVDKKQTRPAQKIDRPGPAGVRPGSASRGRPSGTSSHDSQKRAQSTSFLSAEAHVELLRRKYQESQMEFRQARNADREPRKPTPPSDYRRPTSKPASHPDPRQSAGKGSQSSREQLEILRQRYTGIVRKDDTGGTPRQKPASSSLPGDPGEATQWPGLRKRRPGQGYDRPG